MSGLRTALACIDSAARELSEQPLELPSLVGEEVSAIERCCYGVRIRFGSGRSIAFPAGVTIDAAGAPVIEP